MIRTSTGTINKGLLSRAIYAGPTDRARQPECALDPRRRFFEIVEDLAKRERVDFHVAMAKARDAEPEEFRGAYPFGH
jgi:hypothetical protein